MDMMEGDLLGHEEDPAELKENAFSEPAPIFNEETEEDEEDEADGPEVMIMR